MDQPRPFRNVRKSSYFLWTHEIKPTWPFDAPLAQQTMFIITRRVSDFSCGWIPIPSCFLFLAISLEVRSAKLDLVFDEETSLGQLEHVTLEPSDRGVIRQAKVTAI